MSFRPLPLPELSPPSDSVPTGIGRLWLHSMPGRLETWAEFLDQANQRRLDRVVCLNPLDEIEYLSPLYYQAIAAGRLPFRWQHLPLLDFGVGADPQVFRHGVEQISHGLILGEQVLLHCAAGIGRTGTVAACVLKNLGQSRDAALAAVWAAGSNPQSALQSGWVDQF